MTRAALAAAVCAVGLVAAAGAVVALGGSDLVPAIGTNVRTMPTPDSCRHADADRDDSADRSRAARSPPPMPTRPSPGGEQFGAGRPRGRAGLGVRGRDVRPRRRHSGLREPADVEDPLQYLDAVVVVYDTVPAAATAYERIAEAIAQCPLTRTATPEPTAPEREAGPDRDPGRGQARPGRRRWAGRAVGAGAVRRRHRAADRDHRRAGREHARRRLDGRGLRDDRGGRSSPLTRSLGPRPSSPPSLTAARAGTDHSRETGDQLVGRRVRVGLAGQHARGQRLQPLVVGDVAETFAQRGERDRGDLVGDPPAPPLPPAGRRTPARRDACRSPRRARRGPRL